MYQSRLHATNGLVSVALDTLSGEILELVKENSWDNMVKSNCHPKAWMPFVLECVIDGKTVKGRPARYEERCKVDFLATCSARMPLWRLGFIIFMRI